MCPGRPGTAPGLGEDGRGRSAAQAASRTDMLWFFELIKNLQMRLKVENEIGTFFSVKATGITEKCVFFVDKIYVDIEDEIRKLENIEFKQRG